MEKEKYVPYQKLSKKKKKELDASRRKTWGGLNPVTRKPENPKAYNRNKAQKGDDWTDSALCFFIHRDMPHHNAVYKYTENDEICTDYE